MKTAATIAILLLSLAMAGCGTLEGKFENVLVRSLSGDRAFVASMYGPLGITSELRKEDAAELRRLLSKTP